MGYVVISATIRTRMEDAPMQAYGDGIGLLDLCVSILSHRRCMAREWVEDIRGRWHLVVEEDGQKGDA
jgi:hypothetical protein